MKRYVVSVMPSANRDIAEIIRYISDDLSNKTVASEHLRMYGESLKLLKQMPTRNLVSSMPTLSSRGIRLLHFGNYALAYKVFDEKSLVEVYGVLYSGSDINGRFSEND